VSFEQYGSDHAGDSHACGKNISIQTDPAMDLYLSAPALEPRKSKFAWISSGEFRLSPDSKASAKERTYIPPIFLRLCLPNPNAGYVFPFFSIVTENEDASKAYIHS